MGLVKNTLLIGAGYVLGTAAGRERYEQIKTYATTLLTRPQVQQLWQRTRATLTSTVSGALDQAGSGQGAVPVVAVPPSPVGEATAGAPDAEVAIAGPGTVHPAASSGVPAAVPSSGAEASAPVSAPVTPAAGPSPSPSSNPASGTGKGKRPSTTPGPQTTT